MDGDGPSVVPKPFDRSKLCPYERQRVKDTWLSVPKNYVEPPPQTRRTSYGLYLPALKAKCTPHTNMLAVARRSLPPIHYATKAEREAQRELEEEMTKEELRWIKRRPFPVVDSGVKKAALVAKTTPRLEALAMPKLSSLSCVKRSYYWKLNHNQRNFLNRTIKEHENIFNQNYPPESHNLYVIDEGIILHASCTGRRIDKEKRHRYICELNKNQRKNFRKRMKLMGLPKKNFTTDKGPDRGPKKKIKEFEPWLTMMSQPRYNALSEKPYDPFKVKSATKTYVASERILIISKPKEIPPPPPLVDFEGKELPPRREWSFGSRKRIVASPRTIELAVPKSVKKKAADDVKEDPFAVLRRALTAYCSPRIKELALPVTKK